MYFNYYNYFKIIIFFISLHITNISYNYILFDTSKNYKLQYDIFIYYN